MKKATNKMKTKEKTLSGNKLSLTRGSALMEREARKERTPQKKAKPLKPLLIKTNKG